MKGPYSEISNRGNAKEFGRILENSIGKNRPASEYIQGTGTIFPILKYAIPKYHKVAYASFVCNIRLQKKETHRVRMTAGGERLNYPVNPSSPAVSILDAKIKINSTISNAKNGARYMVINIKNFYLGTPMEYYQYLHMHHILIPEEVME